MFPKCGHSASDLCVEREPTVEPIDAEFSSIVYHLFCVKCGQPVTIKHAKLNASVNAFLKGADNG